MKNIAYILAVIIMLAIVLVPLYLIILGLIALTRKVLGISKKNEYKNKDHKGADIYGGAYQTGWTWNEARQLWEPPNNIKNQKQPSGAYRYKRDELIIEKPYYTKYGYTNDTDSNIYQTKPEYKPPIHTASQYKPEAQKVEYQKYAEYQGAYKATPILTENERRNFQILKEAADKKGYNISIKVRLADLIKPKAGADYMSKFGKIKSKHVDFVVYDQNIRPKLIIELDDRTHDRKDRQDRDEFVDTILRDAGYKIIHTRHITPDILDDI